MYLEFLWLALLFALVDWYAVGKNLKTIEYIAKPSVMLTLLVWLWRLDGLHGQMIWFAFGLLFSLAGDIFLMLPKERFIAGLAAFLLAHLAYIVGLNPTPPPISLPSLILLVMVVFTTAQVYRRLVAGITARKLEGLQRPILFYSIVISLMLLSALATLVRTEWKAFPSLWISLGALLFFISDATLAWNKFVVPLPYARLRVIIAYHIGQIAIVLGAVLHYLSP